ncbi:hypothetical protein JXA59_02400 [Patescibacteria group bacterium]|nr:hypothetical protein [Patescibacteria group bacterium]
MFESARELTDQAVAKLPTITDCKQRLEAMASYQTQLDRMLSKDPMWPSNILGSDMFNQLRLAAGLDGTRSEAEMLKVVWANRELMEEPRQEKERLAQEYGIGVGESAAILAPYYTACTLRWLLLLTLAGLAGALILMMKLRHFGYDWKRVAEREYGSMIVAYLVAPFANLLLLEAYEERGIYGDCTTAASGEIGLCDALRLSFGFRAAIIATIAGTLTNLFGGVHAAMAADGQRHCRSV